MTASLRAQPSTARGESLTSWMRLTLPLPEEAAVTNLSILYLRYFAGSRSSASLVSGRDEDARAQHEGACRQTLSITFAPRGMLVRCLPIPKTDQRAFWHTKSWGKGSESVNYGNTGGSNATIGLANGLNQCELAHSYYNIRTRTYAVIHMFTPIPKAIY